MNITEQYHELLQKILDEGIKKPSGRNNMPDTLYLFGEYMKIDLNDGFPLITTKKVSFKNIVVELLWFLRGDSNIKYLIDNRCNIWNEDAYNYYVQFCENSGNGEAEITFEEFVLMVKQSAPTSKEGYNWGDTGKQYPSLWRNWNVAYPEFIGKLNSEEIYEYKEEKIDQIKNLIDNLKDNPYSRRHKIQSFNPASIDKCALAPCHTDATIDVSPDNKLNCSFHMRSSDAMLGLPYNIASYALLTHILAKVCNYEVGNLIVFLDNVHIYENHINAAKEQLERNPNRYNLPKVKIDWDKNYISNINKDLRWLDKFSKIEDFQLDNYQSYPKLSNSTTLNTGMK